ncbi:putative epoxide hydrolase 2 [Rosellinia necatrix]|uniref:Putative epoxide hydrolase 2 n=1 Tax=Rosellinia necatrix TaxID=77044 RepID=A0A1S7ULE4_ROSNE|nr:putative epoxide hydrolase 2 [Rosellinia necatrix]
MRGLYNFISRAALLSLATAAGSSRVTTKSIVTNDGYTYVYDHVAPHNASMPTILLLHGYPASRYHWHHQIQPLSDAGFGIIAPDSLGYGDSSKPTAVEAYVFRDMADHVAEILDAEGLADVVGVGHDWGSGVLSRSAVFHPERFSKLVFMSAGYFAPGTFFDVDAINAEGLESLGYTPFGYWYFFNSYDSAEIIAQNLESFFHLCYATNGSAWGADFGHLTAARRWLAANRTTELPAWLSAEDKAVWLREYGAPDAAAASLNYYRAQMRGVQVGPEAGVTDARRMLRVPVLAVGGGEDRVTLPGALGRATRPWAAAGYAERVVAGAGHWLMLERPDEVSRILVEFASPAAAEAEAEAEAEVVGKSG